MKVSCPDCDNPLEFMSAYVEDNKVIALFYCDQCNNELDKEWEVTYSRENGVEKIERYYFG
jgi:hypothetical protein